MKKMNTPSQALPQALWLNLVFDSFPTSNFVSSLHIVLCLHLFLPLSLAFRSCGGWGTYFKGFSLATPQPAPAMGQDRARGRLILAHSLACRVVLTLGPGEKLAGESVF